MTLTEKIISKACGRPSVSPNDNVWVNTDVLMTHDVCGPGTIGNFYKEFGPKAKVKEIAICVPFRNVENTFRCCYTKISLLLPIREARALLFRRYTSPRTKCGYLGLHLCFDNHIDVRLGRAENR